MAEPVVGLWDLPSGWEWRRLREIAEIVGGGTPRNAADPANFALAGVPWITPADLSKYDQPTIARGARSLSEIGFRNSAARRLPPGSVLVSSRAPVGYCAVAEGSVATNQGFKSLVLPPSVDPFFVRYYILRSRQYLQDNASGTTFKELSGAAMGELLLPIPPVETQRRIVSRIDELFGAIDEGERLLSAACQGSDSYRDALLREAFSGRLTEHWRARNASMSSGDELRDQLLADRAIQRRGRKRPRDVATPLRRSASLLPASWAIISIEELCDPDRLIAYGVLQPGPNVPDGLRLVRVGDINGGQINHDEMKRIAPKVAASYSRTMLQGGEVLLTVVGSIGRTAVVPSSLAGANVARAVAVLPIRAVEPEWVEFYLRYEPHRRELEGASHEVARKTLNLEDVRRFAVAVPPAPERAEILAVVGSRLESLREAVSPLERASTFARQQRQSILAAAFRGDLVA